MEKIQGIKINKLKTKPEDISNWDIDKWENTATKRYSLFRWDATDPNGWLKSIHDFTFDSMDGTNATW
jgi:hypothetical protein